MPVLALSFLLSAACTDRTPAIYRCPAGEATGARLNRLIEEFGFDALCIDPQPGAEVLRVAKGKVEFIRPKLIDTSANRKWRDATINFASGHISPKQWLAATKGLNETVHFLSSPKTPNLRDVMNTQHTFPLSTTYSAPSVFAEMILLSWPGRPCLTSSDVWLTRELPDAGKLQSWVLAMNDYLGPMLYYRFERPEIVTGKPQILRADAKPGLLICRHTRGGKTLTVCINNSQLPIEVPSYIDIDDGTIMLGIDVEGPKPLFRSMAFAIIEGKAK